MFPEGFQVGLAGFNSEDFRMVSKGFLEVEKKFLGIPGSLSGF